MRDPTNDPSQERLNELFEYRDGSLYNKTKRSQRSPKGSRAGTLNKTGYERILIDKRLSLSHRLIYIMHEGDIPEGLVIDHKNGIRNDNRIDNLRVVTRQQNQFNTNAKGYYWNKVNKKWQAGICVNYKIKYLGAFDKEEDARQAYLVAKEKYHIIEER